MDEVQKSQEDRGNKVHNLLNKMTELDLQNDGAHLVNFMPLELPSLTKTNNTEVNKQLVNMQSYNSEVSNKKKPNGIYSADDRPLGNLTNYQNGYSGSSIFSENKPNKPYYANMGISSSQDDTKIMERINYMIHLLEQQQYEKTANITEEFLLYTFLGVFVIYVVDSFTKNGKYIR
jgi:hypothetical protein